MLALAIKAAKDYGQDYVGSEHLLAGIMREKDGFAARAMLQFGMTEEWLSDQCGWKTRAEIEEERERREYERLKKKFSPQNANDDRHE